MSVERWRVLLCWLLLVGWLRCVAVQSVDAGRVSRCVKSMLEAD